MRRVSQTLAVALLFVSGPADVSAHPLAPAVLSLMPGPDEGTVTMTWRAPVKRPKGQALEPRIPGGCDPLGPTERQLTANDTAVIDTTLLRCDPPDLVGSQRQVHCGRRVSRVEQQHVRAWLLRFLARRAHHRGEVREAAAAVADARPRSFRQRLQLAVQVVRVQHGEPHRFRGPRRQAREQHEEGDGLAMHRATLPWAPGGCVGNVR